MAAWDIYLTGFSSQDGSELLSIEPGWWPIDEMKDHVNFNWVETNDTGSYTDLDADITVDEARALHEQFKSLARKGRYAEPEAQDFIKQDLDAIESAVGERASEFSHFHVRLAEWDSGL